MRIYTGSDSDSQSGDRGRIPRWLNIALVVTLGLLAISCLRSLTVMSSALRASKSARGVVIARLGQLPVGGGAREMRNGQGSNKHYKGENNDERSAFRCAII